MINLKLSLREATYTIEKYSRKFHIRLTYLNDPIEAL